MFDKNYKEKIKFNNKYYEICQILDCWLGLRQSNIFLSEFFEKRGYYKIAIYGMGIIGKRLVDELYGTSIKVLYGIDRNADHISTYIDVYSLEDDLQSVDLIVNTVLTNNDIINNALEIKLNCPQVTIKEILESI